MKKSVPIKPFWYADVLVMPKMVTVITTVNKEGIINAASGSTLCNWRDGSGNDRGHCERRGGVRK